MIMHGIKFRDAAELVSAPVNLLLTLNRLTFSRDSENLRTIDISMDEIGYGAC
jgi:hypothetical protein